MKTRERDAAAKGPNADMSLAPKPGERCPRCHRRERPERCALCAPAGSVVAAVPRNPSKHDDSIGT